MSCWASTLPTWSPSRVGDCNTCFLSGWLQLIQNCIRWWLGGPTKSQGNSVQLQSLFRCHRCGREVGLENERGSTSKTVVPKDLLNLLQRFPTTGFPISSGFPGFREINCSSGFHRRVFGSSSVGMCTRNFFISTLCKQIKVMFDNKIQGGQ